MDNEDPACHPLLADRGRLDQVVWTMRATAQRVLFPHRRLPSPGGDDPEWVIQGGTSVDDVVQEALSALLAIDPAGVESFEALGVDIARKRAVDALRRSQTGQHKVFSLEAQTDAPDSPAWWERYIEGEAPDPAREFVLLQQERRLWEVARTLLDPRERHIFYQVHYLDRARADVGRDLVPRLTGQRVGQIYAQSIRRLRAALTTDPQFPAEYGEMTKEDEQR